MTELLETQNQYIVHLDLFEGPLDLLLHLVKVNEIDIYDIPIAEITNQYLEYLDLMRELNINVAAEFLILASTLIYLKSCELLPPPPGEKAIELEDIKAEFTRRLIEYQAFKNVSGLLSKKDKENIGIFSRPSLPLEKLIAGEDELIDVTLFDLMTALKNILERLSTVRSYNLRHQRYFVEDKIKEIKEILKTKDLFPISLLFKSSRNRAEAITYFLAVLEMMKEKWIRCVQKILFGEIYITKAPQENGLIQEKT